MYDEAMGETATLEPWPRRPRRLATAVVEELVERVVAGHFAGGTSLPTEPVLCETFGVSRTVIREAVKALETMRLVKVQQGQGTSVRPLDEWDLLDPMVLAAVVRHDAELAILDDLVDVRRSLESQMAGQAATRLTGDDRALIEQRMAALDADVEDYNRYRVADVAFHDAIHRASGNRLGRAIIQALTEQAYRSLRYVGDPTPDECRLSNVAHRAVMDAVLSGDPGRAAEAMNDHILQSWLRRRPTPGDVARRA
jgi:DNA-binding FadR family transcriptional regulator